MKAQMTEKDRTLAKQKSVYREIRNLRDKNRQIEKERLEQDQLIRELKTSLAQVTRDNVLLRKKLFKKDTSVCLKKPLKIHLTGSSFKDEPFKTEPFCSWVSPIDQQITPIRHVIISKRGEVVSQDQLFD